MTDFGCLIDIDGTLYEGDRPVNGARETLASLRDHSVPFRLTTNTSRMSCGRMVGHLRKLGIEVSPEEVLTAPLAAVLWLRRHGIRNVMLRLPEATHEDFEGFESDEVRPDAVVVGDLADAWSFERLNEAFQALRSGARLVAIHKNRFWNPGTGPQLDAGPFVVALEFAAETEAVLVGKPNPEFFAVAAADLDREISEVLVVGDNPETDVAGAVACGCAAVAVRTGAGRELSADEQPPGASAVLDSIADLPACLGL